MTERRSSVVALRVIARNIIGEAFASLSGRRLQAALSSFGIATGIAAVVLLVSIVSGIHRYAMEQFGAVGGNVIQVTAQQQRSTRDPQGFPLTLRVEDMDAVLASVDHFDLGMAENNAFGIVRTPRRASQGVQVRGITERGFELLALQAARGRTFLEQRVRAGRARGRAWGARWPRTCSSRTRRSARRSSSASGRSRSSACSTGSATRWPWTRRVRRRPLHSVQGVRGGVPRQRAGADRAPAADVASMPDGGGCRDARRARAAAEAPR